MKWREISDNEVEATINNPEKITDSIKGRKNALKHIENKLIKVTFREENDNIEIITVLDKNNQEISYEDRV